MAIHGLFIGNDYKGTDYELPDCELDARNVCAAFKPYCQSTVLLTGAKATRDGIHNAGRRIKAELKDDDGWLISNSSHGTVEWKGRKRVEAIVCHGGDLIYDFEMDELLDDERPKNSRVIVFSDSCFSGGMERAFRTHIRRTIGDEHCRSHKATPPAVKRPLPGVIYFSASRDNEESFSTGKGGAMTLAVLKAFYERRSNATFADLFKRIAGRGGLLPTDDYPQHPQCFGSQADLGRSLESFLD